MATWTTASPEPGKWYVVDRFDPRGAKLGPFATKAAVEKERRSINIADDCVVLQAKLHTRTRSV